MCKSVSKEVKPGPQKKQAQHYKSIINQVEHTSAESASDGEYVKYVDAKYKIKHIKCTI